MEIKELTELGYLVKYVVNTTDEELGPYNIEFTVFELPYFSENDDVFLTCRMKWDGCSDWDFKDCNHFCGMEKLDNFTKLIHKLWEICDDYFTGY